MRAYLAGRYGRREELADVARKLRDRGIDVQADWLSGAHDDTPDSQAAALDLADVDECHVLIAFTELPGVDGRARGGRHFEAGYAHALGKPVIVIGPAENVFYSLAFERFESLSEFFLALEGGTLPGICRECGCTDAVACPDGCSWTDETATECTAHVAERAMPKRSGLVITGLDDFDGGELPAFAPEESVTSRSGGGR